MSRPAARRRQVSLHHAPQRDRRRPSPQPRRAPGPAGQVFTIPGYAILPLRLFLGFTFLYAGWQKLTDPGFFTPGSHTYIGTQLVQFSHNAPIAGLLSHLADQAVFIGWLTIFTEMAIGLAVLLGFMTRLAALGGLLLNLIFFLSASWNVYPYFLGSDIVFVAAWLTLAIAGPGAYALDPLIADTVAEVVTRPVQRLIMGQWAATPAVHLSPFAVREVDDGAAQHTAKAGEPQSPKLKAQSSEPTNNEQRTTTLSRREAIAGGVVTCVLLILGLAPRVKLGTSALSSPATPGGQGGIGAAPTPVPNNGVVVNLNQLPVNSAFNTTDPKSGDPAVIVHTNDDHVFAYDAICTHAGCTVQYDNGYKLLICPCHGGAFDPAQGAQVVAGPPPGPLTPLAIRVDKSGNVKFA